MSGNPFRVGDKVVENMHRTRTDIHKIGVATVVLLEGRDFVHVDRGSQNEYHRGNTRWHVENLRAAIAGIDYPVHQPETNSGHLPDGSSVQKHSAGPLYPCVLVIRDGKLGGAYDYGVISPRNQEPLWLSNPEAATAVANIIKKDLK